MRVVGPIAAGLENIDADNLVARQPGRERGLCIGSLDIEVGCRPVWNEAELLGGILEKIRDDGNLRPFWRRWSRLYWLVAGLFAAETLGLWLLTRWAS